MRRLVIGMAVMALFLATIPAMASGHRTTSGVIWTWGEPAPGSSTLVRTDNGLSANYRTEDVPAGQAVTLWFIVFNNPDACEDTPCSVVDLLFNEAAEGDFLIGAGNVIGGSERANFGGSVKIGDTSGSAFHELGMPDRAIGLTNPLDAEVHLALHSHGPALTGQVLKSQISSFLGGCEEFVGNEFGIADDPGDLLLAEGECTTFQVSIHG